jgi:hypothetical protein
VLALPSSSFYKSLASFQKISIYANAVNDLTVRFSTGAIEEVDWFGEAGVRSARAFKAMEVKTKRKYNNTDQWGLGGLEYGGLKM